MNDLTPEDRAELARLDRNAAAIHSDIAGLLAWNDKRNNADLVASKRASRIAERLDPDGC